MRLLYFHQYFSTPAGSSGTRSYEFARCLVARGHHVTVVCGSYNLAKSGLSDAFVKGRRSGVVDGIEVIEIELPLSNADSFFKRTLTFFRFVTRTLRIALEPGYDVLFATSTPLTVALPGIVAKVILRRKFIFEVRDLWPELPQAMGVIRNPVILFLMGVLESAAYRAADACIGLAPGIVEGIRRKVPHAKTAMIPNGADLPVQGVHVALPDELERLLASSEGKLKCIFAGAHGIANGLDAVLDAAEELLRRGRRDIVLVFIGTGMKKQFLMKRAQVERLDNCIFLEPVSKRMVFELQARMDVGLMILMNVPAFYNGTSPNKFFDYLACGLPVLINYPGWLADLVVKEGCGLAVPPQNAPAFADALQRLADSPQERRDMGSRAYSLAVQKFSRGELGSQFVQFVEAVAGNEASA